MEYQKLYEDYSPLKFNLNQEYIENFQRDQPVNVSIDNLALNNAKIRLNEFVNELSSKYNLLYEKGEIIQNMYLKSIKLFLALFIVLYLIAPKYEILRLEDETNNKVYKPNLFRISLIACIISFFYILIQGIDVLGDIKNIILFA
jgi:hypothetical protein